jgi:hypothetical protein
LSPTIASSFPLGLNEVCCRYNGHKLISHLGILHWGTTKHRKRENKEYIFKL